MMEEEQDCRIIRSNTDRMSDLPDCILAHILSFLSTEQAVATSILSKRWKFLWFDVHNLDFNFFCNSVYLTTDIPEIPAFIEFVNRALLLIDDRRPLNKFSLTWHPFYISSHVISWIDAAIRRKVREIHLELGIPFTVGPSGICRIPISGFNCDSLLSLQLNIITFVYDMVTTVCLPRLETLTLDRVCFESEETFEKLISGCPMLQHFKITIPYSYYDDSDDDANKVFMYLVSSPSLRHLDMEIGLRCTLRLKAPSLEYLSLQGSISEIYVDKSLSSLLEARFDIDSNKLDSPHYSIAEAIHALEHAKFLTLSAHVMHALCLFTASLSTEFKRLVKLVATTDCSSLQDFIHNAENLEVLKIYLDNPDHSRWTAPIEVPRCLSKSLKEFNVADYGGLEDEREMIRYMLEHGISLQVMRIYCSSKEDGEKIELLQEICEFPRKSPACKVQFHVWPGKRKFDSPNGLSPEIDFVGIS